MLILNCLFKNAKINFISVKFVLINIKKKSNEADATS